MARAFIFLLVTIAYAGVWLALAMLFSIIFRSAATAALVTLGLWLFLTLIWPALAPGDRGRRSCRSTDEETLILAAQMLSRLSPEHAVRRGGDGDPQSVDALARADLS